jgi:peptide/nickel transport system permease protein
MTTAEVVSLRTAEEQVKSTSLWRDAARRFVRHPVGMTGAVLVTLLIITALFGPSFAPYDPNEFVDFSARFGDPTGDYLMGLDDFGRDIFSRVIYGAQVSLRVGIIAVGIAAATGTLLGMVAGFSRRILDEIIMRLMDILFAFPPILLAIAIMAALGKGVTNAMIAIGIVYIPIFARIARGATLSIKEEDFILASRALGANDAHILRAHIFPNIVSPIIVEITLSLSFAILAEAALSFFGLGTQIPDPSWGRMLKEGQTYYQQSIWMSIFPGLAIMLTVMGFNFLGDGLRDALDPKMKNV